MKKFIDVLRAVAVVGLVPLMTVQQSLAWGVDGHHMINRQAGKTLPADVPAFPRSPDALNAMMRASNGWINSWYKRRSKNRPQSAA